MKDTRRFALAAVLPLAFALPGCGGGTLLSDENQERAELERSRAIWRSSGIRRYSFAAQYRVGSTTRLSLDSSVLEESILTSSVQDVNSGEARDPGELTAAYGTVDRMFETIEAAMEDGDETLNVDYSVSYGYPVSITTGTADPSDDRPLTVFSMTQLGFQD